MLTDLLKKLPQIQKTNLSDYYKILSLSKIMDENGELKGSQKLLEKLHREYENV